MAQTNLYVDTGDNCHPPGAIQYVWFDTAVFAMDGWTPTQLDQFEGAIVRAIAVWNEESNSQRTLRYGGRGGPKGRPGDANDTFISATIGAQCTGTGFSTWAKVSQSSPTSVCNQSRSLTFFLRTCGAMTPSVPSPFAFYWPNPGQPSVEGILIHELGHVSFGFDDQTAGNSSPRGVMWGMIPDGPVGYWLHLYRADQDTAIFGGAGSSGEGMGATLQRTAVQEIDASGAWVGTSPELLADLRTTFGPALATRHSNSGYWGSAFLMRSTRGAGYAFSSGLPSSWLFEGALNNYWLATAQSNHSSVGLAYSRYDEVTGAWFECSMLTSNNCIVVTAMRAPGSAWQEHVHYQPTIARPEVAYDAWTDRFVLLFIHEDGRLWTSSTPAWGVQWTAPAPLVFSDGATRHFRYMGGLVFEYLPPGGPPGAPGVPYGWAFAASADPRADGVLTPIVQMALSYQTATSSYVAGVPALPIPGSSAAAFDTIRHFDVGDAMDGDAHVLAFLRASYAPWQQRVVTSRRVGATGTFTVPVEMSWYRSGAITSSVAVSHNANLNNRFVIGVGGEP